MFFPAQWLYRLSLFARGQEMVINWLAACCLLPKVQLVGSSRPVHSSRDQSCAKLTQVGFAGADKISRCEDRECVLLAYRHFHVLLYLGLIFASACEELTLKLRGRFILVLVTCLPDESPEAEAGEDSKPATPSAWQAVTEEHFECDPLPILGKL